MSYMHDAILAGEALPLLLPDSSDFPAAFCI
jgi:hypothetical protein